MSVAAELKEQAEQGNKTPSGNTAPHVPPSQNAEEKKDSKVGEAQQKHDGNTPQANTEGDKPADVKEGQEKPTQGDRDKQELSGKEDPFKDLALPEKSFLSSEDLEEIKAFAREKGLSAEQAKMLLERENQAIAGWVGLQRETLERERQEKWLPALKADPEFGGSRFEETDKSMKSFFERFDPHGEFQKQLEASGLRYFPPLWKMLARASQAAARDRILPGQPADVAGAARRLSNAEVFYGKISHGKSPS